MKYLVGETIAGRYVIRAANSTDFTGERYEVMDLSTKLNFSLQLCKPISGSSGIHRKGRDQAIMNTLHLTHEAIAPVYDVGHTESGDLFMILDTGPVFTLRELLKREDILPQDQALSILIQIAQALFYAHQNGQLHGHLTPINIQITESAQQTYQAKVTGFGMDQLTEAKYADSDRNFSCDKRLSMHAHYVSPEQCRFGALNEQTDIYSFGCIMFQLLTGKPPFYGGSAAAVLWQHVSEPIPVLPQNLVMRQSLQAVVNACLEKDPRRRYSDALSLTIDLDRILQGRRINRNIGSKPCWLGACLRLSACWSFFLRHLNLERFQSKSDKTFR